MKENFYITTPIYYVNDKPHIGHAYTTTVADVLARYYRQKLGEENVFFLTGTDEHGSKVAKSAEKEGLDPQSFTDEVSAKFQDAWDNLGISNDMFIRTSSEEHKNIVGDILNLLKEAKTPKGNDVLYEEDYEGLYCVGCESFISEGELVDGKCPDHGKEPELVKEKNWFFRLNDFLDDIQKLIESDELLIYPKTRKNEVLGLIKQDIPDFSISRSNKAVTWGVDIPWDNSQKAYVWVDALSNYISALGYPDGENYKKFWPANVQLLALDILKFHALYWPAILMAIDAPLPKALYVHGFFTINGQKMSKTLGNVIDPNELVEKFGNEVAKYLILAQFSFGNESDIRADEFPARYKADLMGGLGNLVNRVCNMIEQYQDGKTNSKLEELPIVEEVGEKIERFKLREALLDIWKLISESNSIIDSVKPWELAKSDNKADKERLAETLDILAVNIYNIARCLKPFMPDTASQIEEIISSDRITKPESPLFKPL